MIAVDRRPCAAVASPEAMWVSAYAAGTVVKIDPTSNAVLTTYRVGDEPCGIVYRSGRLWVGLVSGHQLVQLDARSGDVMQRIDTGSPVFDVQIGLGSVWVATRDGRVLRVDPEAARIVADTPVGVQLYGLAVTTDAVWAAEQSTHDIVRLDPASATVTAHVHDPNGTPYTFASTPGALWVSSDDGTTLRVDTATNRIVATIPFGMKGGAPGDPDTAGGSVWVPNRDTGELARIDPSTNQVQAIVALPAGFSVAQEGFGSIWVCDYSGAMVARVDPATAALP